VKLRTLRLGVRSALRVELRQTFDETRGDEHFALDTDQLSYLVLDNRWRIGRVTRLQFLRSEMKCAFVKTGRHSGNTKSLVFVKQILFSSSLIILFDATPFQ
jgi:hypothetical protein